MNCKKVIHRGDIILFYNWILTLDHVTLKNVVFIVFFE